MEVLYTLALFLLSLVATGALFRWKVTFPVLTFRSCHVSQNLNYDSRVTDLNVDLVTAENDRNVFTDPLQISVPVGDILVGDTRSNVEHDDTTLTLNVVSVSQTTELFLSCSVPNVEADGTEVCVESEGVDLDTESG